MENQELLWDEFAKSGSVLSYLSYKSGQVPEDDYMVEDLKG